MSSAALLAIAALAVGMLLVLDGHPERVLVVALVLIPVVFLVLVAVLIEALIAPTTDDPIAEPT